MINIIFCVTPNYEKKKKLINTIYKKIDLIDQLIMAYYSIKKNWKNLDYDISLFYNKDMPYNEEDTKLLESLEINLIPCSPDHPRIPYMCRGAGLKMDLPKKGSHRLIMDCDVLALNEPTFNLEMDWQAMFAGNALIPNKDIEYINKKYNYNLDLSNFKRNDLFKSYLLNPNKYDNFFPHFNAGAFLIKEELCKKFVSLYEDANSLTFDNNITSNHIAIQYARSFALIKLSKKWQPFQPGFNYLGKSFDIHIFGKENIILFHYCGTNGEENVFKHFKEYLINRHNLKKGMINCE